MPKPTKIPRNKMVNASEVFQAGGIIFLSYNNGVWYKYPRSKRKDEYNPIKEMMIASRKRFLLYEIMYNEPIHRRKRIAVAGDINPTGTDCDLIVVLISERSIFKEYPLK
jgi:hypothetical protein